MPITVEPGVALNYLQDDPDFVSGHLSMTTGYYIISQRTFVQQWPRVYEVLRQGGVVAVEKTDESIVTQWHIVSSPHYVTWIKTGQLRWITGGDAPDHICNLNTEHFLAATVGSGFEPIHQWPAQRPYSFLFTSRKLRPHRRYLISEMNKMNLFENALWANHEDLDSWGHPDFNRVYTRDSVPKNTLPQGYDPDPMPSWVDGVIVPEQYQHTWFSVITETVHEDVHSFRTEKTYKALLAGHPFIVSANAGFLEDLHNMGFETYDHWIDEIYDQIQDGERRIQSVVHEIKWLLDQDLSEFWRETERVRLCNQRRALELHNSQLKTFNQQLKEFMYAAPGK